MNNLKCECCEKDYIKEDGYHVDKYYNIEWFCGECEKTMCCILCGETESLNYFNGSWESVCSPCLLEV